MTERSPSPSASKGSGSSPACPNRIAVDWFFRTASSDMAVSSVIDRKSGILATAESRLPLTVPETATLAPPFSLLTETSMARSELAYHGELAARRLRNGWFGNFCCSMVKNGCISAACRFTVPLPAYFSSEPCNCPLAFTSAPAISPAVMFSSERTPPAMVKAVST
ncbi:hypothetical protein D3C78_1343500 [compost metagenome]